MKNVTVTLDEDLAHWARVWAAQQGRSLSRALAAVLERERTIERAQAAAAHEAAASGLKVMESHDDLPAGLEHWQELVRTVTIERTPEERGATRDSLHPMLPPASPLAPQTQREGQS